MEDSILISMRKVHGPDADYDYFDDELIMHINTQFFKLSQIGVGPLGGFSITGTSEVWSDFSTDEKIASGAKDYVWIQTKLRFDPPLNASVLEALKEQAAETFTRLSYYA